MIEPENKRASQALAGDGIAQVSLTAEHPIAQETESHAHRAKNRKVRYAEVFDILNLRNAEREARRGKSQHYGVRKWDRHAEDNLLQLQQEIATRTYHTTTPKMEARHCEHKTRILSKVYYRDHVAHHALMRVIMPVLERSYYYESAASIRGRGIHYSMKHVRRWIDLNQEQPLWWAQLDFKKFYHHINRSLLYQKLCRTFQDEGIRYMLHDVIYCMGNHNGLTESDGTEGLGIGLYPVQPLANYYLNDFDRKVSALPDVKMFRYCDNILLIGYTPRAVWHAINYIKEYADTVLHQPLHTNIGVQRLDDRHPIDYVGYQLYTDHTLIRKRMKEAFRHKLNHTTDPDTRHSVLASYKGCLEHANGLHLWQTVTKMKTFSQLNISHTDTMRDGQRYFEVPVVSASFLTNRTVIVKDFIEGVQTRNGNDRFCILVEENGTDKKFLTNNPRLKDIMRQVRELGELPFQATLRSRTLAQGKVDYYFE